MAAIEAPLVTAGAARTGRRLAWLGYLTIFGSIAGFTAFNGSRSDDAPTAFAMLAMVGANSGPVRRSGRVTDWLALPLLAAVYKALDAFSPWWLLSLPTLTYEPALVLTAFLALPAGDGDRRVERRGREARADALGAAQPDRRGHPGDRKRVGTAGDAPTGRHRWNLWIGQAVAAPG